MSFANNRKLNPMPKAKGLETPDGKGESIPPPPIVLSPEIEKLIVERVESFLIERGIIDPPSGYISPLLPLKEVKP